ncbi:major facilitator superfamily domain-containing protein [Suillus clintonianus]|uniref:major facilitator superfamily domain-containing protein n=1 Tax=Suillus clintonianus TaxID=1904413 RepID=UPI001B872861|nr:major facilitator superfamily domain-containing protein [Suillus clintonianus]KAG2153348.1 major facilitator superfamily domain-containing protein [Suillus clintonianus]
MSNYVEEKKKESYDGDVDIVTTEDEEYIMQPEIRQAAERRLVRKLDFRLLPTIVLIFIMNYIDRVAITSARLKGLESDLGLTDLQYYTVVAILYVSYCPAQIPSNMLLNYVTRPTFYIGTCVVLWGVTSALTGVTHNFAGIIACRIFIGLPEAAFYPGAMYLLSRWYTRKELAFRSAILYSGLLLSNAFGSLIAAGILGNMQGVLGIAAWRWLFYIEGAITIFVGFQAMWLLPDYPNNTRWLTPAERRLAQARLAEDAGEADQDSAEASVFEGFKMAIKDPKVPVFMFMCCSQLLGLSFVNFFPTLTSTLGYSTTVTLLMSAPPWIFASICTLIGAWHADKTGERFFHQTAWWWVVMVGYIISLSTMATAGRYFSLFLMTTGYCGFTLTLVWVANAIPRPPAKRSVAMGLVNGFGNLGNVMGSYIWNSKWSPQYHQSMIIALCALALASFLSFVIRWMLVRENKQMEREEMDLMHGPERQRIEEAAKLEGITFEEAIQRRKGFRYLY